MEEVLYCKKCGFEGYADELDPTGQKTEFQCPTCLKDDPHAPVLQLVCGYCHGDKRVPVYAMDPDSGKYDKVGEKKCLCQEEDQYEN